MRSTSKTQRPRWGFHWRDSLSRGSLWQAALSRWLGPETLLTAARNTQTTATLRRR